MTDRIFRTPGSADRVHSGRGEHNGFTEEQRVNVGRVMKQARREKNVTQQELAVVAGTSGQAIGFWERGLHSTTMARLLVIANFLNFDLEKAKSGEKRPAPEQGNVEPPPKDRLPDIVLNYGDDWMAVHGTSDLGNGAFLMEGVIAQLRRPPGLRQSKKVTAFNVASENMMPRHRIGDLIYVQRRIAAPGDDILVELLAADDSEVPKSYLLELVKTSDKFLFCRQHNPARNREFDWAKVQQVSKVLTTAELIG